jgi:predicted nucleic acid-binding protein
MRVVISDASPIRYLVLIGEVEILGALYERVFIPKSVALELNQPKAPDIVKQWMAHPPVWLEVQSPSQPLPTNYLPHLDIGERDAVLLALEIKADLVLMDDREGVEEAKRLGLHITGTLGVLDRASQKGLLGLPAAVQRLRKTNVRASPALLDRLLADDAARNAR